MATRTGLTLEGFLDVAETKPASEYACGDVTQKPMPDIPHAAIQVFVGVVLYAYLEQTGLGRVFPELRCVFGPPGDVRAYVPDLVYITKGRLPAQRDLHAAPDLAIEVLSLNQHMPGFNAKIAFYLNHGVRLIWVIDPDAARITVHAPGVEQHSLRSGDSLDGGVVLPGFNLAVDDIFAQMQT